MQRTRMLLAFAAIYLIWGSTCYAIRVGVESLPPLGRAGTSAERGRRAAAGAPAAA
jgi:hypothetical protein